VDLDRNRKETAIYRREKKYTKKYKKQKHSIQKIEKRNAKQNTNIKRILRKTIKRIFKKLIII
jgi:hypothetical protein